MDASIPTYHLNFYFFINLVDIQCFLKIVPSYQIRSGYPLVFSLTVNSREVIYLVPPAKKQ